MSQLVALAEGYAWQFQGAPGYAPAPDLTVISALPYAGGTLYRVVGPVLARGITRSPRLRDEARKLCEWMARGVEHASK